MRTTAYLLELLIVRVSGKTNNLDSKSTPQSVNLNCDIKLEDLNDPLKGEYQGLNRQSEEWYIQIVISMYMLQAKGNYTPISE